ncbi:MAG: DUF3769 domain-containing protein [Nostoc sp.]|uniref:DUF3769 domain-containing protein n=1 Tax=Nostoc sp. TaxID=1180 RepID=UPI002FF889CB
MLHPVLPPDPPPIVESLQPVNPASSASHTKFLSGVDTGIREKTDKSKQPKNLAQLAIAGNTKSDPPLRTLLNSTQDNLVVAETPSVPHSPETFPPETSPLTGSRSAAFLGQPLVVGYPTQEVTTSNGQDQENTKTSPSIGIGRSQLLLISALRKGKIPREGIVDSGTFSYRVSPNPLVAQSPPPLEIAPIADSHKLVESKAEIVAEKLTQEKQQRDITTQESPKGDNISVSTTDLAPGSQSVQNFIEFKSRNPTNQLSKPITVEFQSQVQQPTPTPKVNTSNQPQRQPSATTAPARTLPATPRTVEVTSDRQEYDEQQRIITAVGNVVVRFDGAVVDADRLQVNLDNLIAAGEGNVTLTRGRQILHGQRFTYNFVQDSGELENARGEIYVPSAQTDLAFLPTDVTTSGVQKRTLSDRVTANQPLSGVSSPGGINTTIGDQTDPSNLSPLKSGGVVNRLRFEAEHIDFYPHGWQGSNVRITNDPFSPPELELRADQATLTEETPLVETLSTQRQRLVFDQTFSLPILLDRWTIDRNQRDVTPFLVSPGYDGTDRGGFYIQRGFSVISTSQTHWTITPQLLVQRAVQEGTGDLGALFGVKTTINSVLSPRTTLQGTGQLSSLDLSQVENNLRVDLALHQKIGDRLPYMLNLQYNYRDLLYNGSLGFQTVQSSFGGILSSPVIPLGKSGINLTYQASAEYINANTDRQDLLKQPQEATGLISLSRLQGSASLNRGFLLWRGKPLAPTATEGLRYTANPVVPYLQVFTGVTGTSSYYSSGDSQSTLTGTIGLQGQIGHFSRTFLDYTAFNISFSQSLNNGFSPFLFDRSVDNKVLSAGISQQIYGPFRLGFQTSINLDTGVQTSTDYIVEYSRRSYGITLRYNPVLQLGGFSIRISDFNWGGGTDPFSEVKPVVNGVQQGN